MENENLGLGKEGFGRRS